VGQITGVALNALRALSSHNWSEVHCVQSASAAPPGEPLYVPIGHGIG